MQEERIMKIVVLDGYTLNPGDNPWDEISGMGDLKVYERSHRDQIRARAQSAQIVLTNKAPISGDTIGDLPDLRFISVLATGYDIVDIKEAGKRGIPVSNVPEYGTDSVAQFVMALLLELCHNAGSHSMSVRAGKWCLSHDWCFWNSPQMLLKNKKMGIVGFGRIGRRLGELAHAFGMGVYACDPVHEHAPDYSGFQWKSLEELFSRSDVVSLHCPQTPENTGFVNSRLLEKMKPGAFFINAARGGLVRENDLAYALDNGIIGGAALDVVSSEPPEVNNPLLAARNCIITPHMAWASLDARIKLMKTTVKNIKAFLANRPENVVNGKYLT